SSGFFASNATAARVFMMSSQGGSSLADPVRRAGLNRQRRLGDRIFIGATGWRLLERDWRWGPGLPRARGRAAGRRRQERRVDCIQSWGKRAGRDLPRIDRGGGL